MVVGRHRSTHLPPEVRGLVPGPLWPLTRVLKPHHSLENPSAVGCSLPGTLTASGPQPPPPGLRHREGTAEGPRDSGDRHIEPASATQLCDPGAEMTKGSTLRDAHEGGRRLCVPRTWDVINGHKCNLKTTRGVNRSQLPNHPLLHTQVTRGRDQERQWRENSPGLQAVGTAIRAGKAEVGRRAAHPSLTPSNAPL